MLCKSLVLVTSSLLGKYHVQGMIHVKSLGTKSICPQDEESEERRHFMNKHQKRDNDPSSITIFLLWRVDGTPIGIVTGQRNSTQNR